MADHRSAESRAPEEKHDQQDEAEAQEGDEIQSLSMLKLTLVLVSLCAATFTVALVRRSRSAIESHPIDIIGVCLTDSRTKRSSPQPSRALPHNSTPSATLAGTEAPTC